MARFRRHRLIVLSMSSKVHCYLRTLRRGWGLSQEEVASLLPKGDRNRVSRVERGKIPPNAREIVAYRLIFGSSVQKAFPKFHADTVEAVMQRAYFLHQKVAHGKSEEDQRKRRFTEAILARATGKRKRSRV